MFYRIATLLLTACLLTACSSLGTNAIPQLDTQGDVYKTEGPNDPLIYDSVVGDKKAIMVYVDFPDKPMTIDSIERQKAVLGGETFDNIFDVNAYGKLSITIEHIHGWRRMPKDSKSYNSGTTESHREMFADIFKLYPEINFLEYDYIMANMKGQGNTAFGERDDIAIPYRGEKINTALNIGSQNPYTLAHELAHCMGLPDLYTYAGVEGPKNPTGPWDIMSSGGATGFLGWHRHKLKWLDADRKTYLSEGTHTLTITPLDGDNGISLIVVPVDNPASPSKVFAIEIAQPIRRNDAPTPGGVLVYSVDATLASGQNSVVVFPRQDIVNAAFHEGDTFEEDDAPMSVKVIKKNEDGSYEVEIVVK